MPVERLYIHQPEILLQARVNMGSITYPLDEITFDTTTAGSWSNLLAGHTLLLGTAAGLDDLGRQRVKGANTTTIRVGRSSLGTRDGELNVADNAFLTVLNEHRVWAKIPVIEIDGDIFKDGDLGPAGNLVDPPPIANGGAGTAGTIDSGTGLLTVTFSGSESREFDETTSALTNVDAYSWDVGDGTITVGTSTTEDITATFPAGFRYVKLTVTSTMGKFHTTYIPVFARDPANDTSLANFHIVSRTITKYGQEISLQVYDEIPRSTYPDGALVMIWEEEPEDDEDRTHLTFVGWHQRDDGNTQATDTAQIRDTVLHCVDVLGRLKTLPGFGQRLKYEETPTLWYHTRYPNIFYYLWYLLHWHSTALEVAGLTLGTQILNQFEFRDLHSEEDNLFEQVNSLAVNITPDHHFTCDYQGRMHLVVDQIIQNSSDRSAVVGQDFEDSEWLEIRFGYQRSPRVNQMKTASLLSGTALVGGEIPVIWALAPGLARGQGEQYIETSERIAASQSQLNVVEGNRYARLNAPYGMVTVILPYMAAVSDLLTAVAEMQWVQLTIDGANEPHRTLPFTSARGIAHEVSVAYDYPESGVTRTITMTWEKETSGPPALTWIPENTYA